MLAPEEDMEINALRKQGWSISAIARHLDRDRKTIRAYLNGVREPGVRAKPDDWLDSFDRFEPYVRQRFKDDPHVWATVLFDEIVAMGFDRSYQRFTHAVRERALRPHCEACAGVKGRATVEIEHEPGAEMQWDWLELPDTPWGAPTNLLVGALSHSSKARGWFSESQDQAHLVEGIHEILIRHGGTPKAWRVDRMSTVIVVGSDRVQPSFVPVAKHYGVQVDPCPPRRGNRKGVVEKNIDFITQRWWRSARVNSPADAQASLDEFCTRVGDARPRDGMTVGELAAAEPLMALPALPFPATVIVERVVAANALVHFEGNRYSVPPGFVGATVSVYWRLGTETIQIVAPSGAVIVEHRRAPKGAGRTTRLPEHAAALENVVLGAFTTDRPCKRKVNRPPSDAALALAAEITGTAGRAPVIDLTVYERVIDEQRGGER